VDVGSENWSAGPLPGLPQLLLIESSGLHQRRSGTGPISDEKVERALELIAWGESERIPTVLWETSLQRRIKTPLKLMETVDRIFVADPESEPALAKELGGRRPMQMPLAAQVIPRSVPSFSERKSEVVFLGRWASWLSGDRRKELEAILAVAARRDKLTIFQREGETSERYVLPERLAPFAVSVPDDRSAIKSFQGSRIVVGFDPRNYGRLMVPQVVFDALAAGSAVIAPNHVGLIRLVDHITIRIKSRDKARREIKRLLGDEEAWSWLSTRGRNAILNAHTYPHRMATIASSVGLRLIPETEKMAPLVTP
jgi:hypothetical protein